MNLTTRIAFREILGGWRGLIVFYLCVIISATVLIVVEEISANFKGNFQAKAKEILGGDLEVITSNFQMDSDQLASLQQYGKVSMVTDLRGMLIYNQSTKIIEIKSIDETYPLYGSFDQELSELHQTDGVLLAQELMVNMGIKIGDMVQIGGYDFNVLGVAPTEPDWFASAFVLGPRVLMSTKSLSKTFLIQPGSLIRYKYRLKLLDNVSLEEAKSAIKGIHNSASWIVRDYKQGNTMFVNSVERFEFFLMLAGISNLLICGVGIAAATRFFMEKKLPHVAVLKSCGAAKKNIMYIYLQLIGLVSLDSFVTSVFFSWLITCYLLPVLNNILPFYVDFHFYWSAIFKVFIFVILTIVTFTLPVLLNSIDIKPASLFRGVYFLEFNHTKERALIYFVSCSVLFFILLLYSEDVFFLSGYLIAAVLTFLIYYHAGNAFKKSMKIFNISGSALRLAIGNIQRPGSSLTTIMLAIGVSLTVFIVLSTTQYNIAARLNDTIPKKAPSLFLIDIQDNQITPLRQIADTVAKNLIIKPSVQGLITHINGKSVENLNINKGSEWAVRNHRRLSYSANAPENTVISQGKWWDANYNGRPLVSLDENLAKGFGVGIGDEITFNILGRSIEAEIYNLRNIDYSSFNINFAVIFSPGIIDNFPKSYFATLKIDDERKEYQFIQDVSDKFPNIVSIRTSDSIEIAKKYIGDIVSAIEIIVLISLASGIIVLAGSFLAHQERRKYDLIILKVLGAGSFDIYKTLVLEAVILSVLAGFISVLIGNVGAYFILKYLRFDTFDFSISQNLLTMVVTICAVIVVIVLSSYKIFSTKPSHILRNE